MRDRGVTMDCKQDIILAISSSRQLTGYEKIDCFKALFFKTKEYDFKLAADEIIDRMQICPECYSDTITRSQSELIGEYMGSPAYERLYIKICPKCGWKED